MPLYRFQLTSAGSRGTPIPMFSVSTNVVNPELAKIRRGAAVDLAGGAAKTAILPVPADAVGFEYSFVGAGATALVWLIGASIDDANAGGFDADAIAADANAAKTAAAAFAVADGLPRYVPAGAQEVEDVAIDPGTYLILHAPAGGIAAVCITWHIGKAATS